MWLQYDDLPLSWKLLALISGKLGAVGGSVDQKKWETIHFFRYQVNTDSVGSQIQKY